MHEINYLKLSVYVYVISISHLHAKHFRLHIGKVSQQQCTKCIGLRRNTQGITALQPPFLSVRVCSVTLFDENGGFFLNFSTEKNLVK